MDHRMLLDVEKIHFGFKQKATFEKISEVN